MSGYRIERTTIADKAEALWPLLVEHREELTTNKAIMELAPDVDKYAALESFGALIALVAYFGDEIVGYAITFTGQHLHYKKLRYAQNDVLFVHPLHRRSRVGLQLIRATEDAAREAGATLIVWHVKPDTVLNAILPHRGYGVQDILYSKEL